MCRKLLNHTTKTFQGLPCCNMPLQWQSALSLQYHKNTADKEYQLLFVVNFVDFHLTAYSKISLWWTLLTGPWPSTSGSCQSKERTLSLHVFLCTGPVDFVVRLVVDLTFTYQMGKQSVKGKILRNFQITENRTLKPIISIIIVFTWREKIFFRLVHPY